MIPPKVLRMQALQEFLPKEIVETILAKGLTILNHLCRKATEISMIASKIAKIGTSKMTVLIDMKGMINLAGEKEEVVNLGPDLLEEMTPAETMNLIRIAQQDQTKERENHQDQTHTLLKEMTKNQQEDDIPLMKFFWDE